MRVLLIHIGVTPSGAPRRREQRLTVNALRIGRAPSNELPLPGLNVSFHHATITRGQALPLLECSESAELRLNGRIEKTSRLEPGDAIRIGRWELRVVTPGPEEELALEIEEKEVRGDELDELRARTQLGVSKGLLSTRRLAWLASLAVFGFFLAAPLGLDWFTGSWSSGTIARKHAFIANDCEKCHEVAFSRVANTSCTACHADVANHTAVEARGDEMMNFRCAICHKDHNGDAKLTSMDQPQCEECHVRISDVFAASELTIVSDFGSDHPVFRFDVVTNPETGERVKSAARPGLRENSGLRFDHLRHVGRLSPLPQGGRGNLDCGQCHEPDEAGLGMQPIAFDRHCQGCHQLTFDAEIPDAEAFHGDPARMRAELRGLYSERVVSGRVRDESAPQTVRFMRPGKTLSRRESAIVSVWVGTMVDRAETYLMKEPGECGACHELLDTAASDGGTDIAAVEINTSWLPAVRFSHGTHAPFQCRSCHPAAAVYDPEDDANLPRPTWSLADSHPYGLLTVWALSDATGIAASETSADILIPDRDQCRTCHRGGGAEPPAVPSECVMCHPFHRSEHGPMYPVDSGSTHHSLLPDSAEGSLPSAVGAGNASILRTHRRVTHRDSERSNVDTW